MEKSDRCRAPPGARADDWDSGNDESYVLRTLSSRRRRRQEHVHRPIRHRTRQQLNKFACFKCQLKKTKCDGARPFCAACVKRHDKECEYPVREGAVSRYADLKVTSEHLEIENKCLKDLLSSLSSLPESEASAIYRKLKLADDPASWTLQDVQDASELLAATNSKVAMIHADAPADSVLKVSAQPWTSVAGDALVSHLVSAFFKWDGPFVCSFIDQELFLRDMQHGSQANNQFCSPLLVNSLCALRSMFSNKVKFVNQATTGNLGAQFMSEARRHLDLEAGKLSLTTVQGLYIMFLVSCLNGTNRAGAMYRLAALDLLSKLQADNPPAIFGSEGPGHADQRRALSEASWGLFRVECLLSNMYLKVPPISPPSIPYSHDTASNATINSDIIGSPFGSNSAQPPIAPGTLPMANQTSLLHYRVMRYNQQPRGPVGDEMDMRVRRDLYLQLTALETSSPTHLQHHNNPTPQTIHLKTHLNLIAHTLLRPLPPSAPFHPPTTTKSLLLTLCAQDIALLETYLAHWPLAGGYSPILIRGVSTAVLTLLPLLVQRSNDDDDNDDDDKNSYKKRDGDDVGGKAGVDGRMEALFTRACVFLRGFAEQVAGVRRIMQGVLAVAWRNGWELPGPARAAFEGLASEEERAALAGGVAMDFVMPGLVGGFGVDLDRVLGEWGGAAAGGGAGGA